MVYEPFVKDFNMSIMIIIIIVSWLVRAAFGHLQCPLELFGGNMKSNASHNLMFCS